MQGFVAGVELVSIYVIHITLFVLCAYFLLNYDFNSNFISIYIYVQDGPMDRCGDGMWKGQQYFSCSPGRACFLPVSHLEVRSNEQYLSHPMMPVAAVAVSQTEHVRDVYN